MRRTWLVGIAALALIASAAQTFAACEGTVTLFEDRFDTLQPTWGEPTDAVSIENRRLIISPEPDRDFWVVNQASLYDDIDMCVTMTTLAGIVPDGARAGLVFWYTDANNFYALELAPNGKASVWRRQRGKWLEQVEWQDVEGAETGDNAVNQLRVVTRGDQATFYINDTEFAELTGEPPADGQLIGFFATSPAEGAARYAFDDLRVTRPRPAGPG